MTEPLPIRTQSRYPYQHGALRPYTDLPFSTITEEGETLLFFESEEIQQKIVNSRYFSILERESWFLADANPLHPQKKGTYFFSQNLISFLQHAFRDKSPSFVSPIWSEKVKNIITGLLEAEDEEEEVAPEAVQYACELVDYLPPECAQLPLPDVSSYADKKAVYFEWTLENVENGCLLLTIEPDGTVAYVCTFGDARSRNLGPWKDRIIDLVRPCFVKLLHLHKKDQEWYDSKTVHHLLDFPSKITK